MYILRTAYGCITHFKSNLIIMISLYCSNWFDELIFLSTHTPKSLNFAAIFLCVCAQTCMTNIYWSKVIKFLRMTNSYCTVYAMHQHLARNNDHCWLLVNCAPASPYNGSVPLPKPIYNIRIKWFLYIYDNIGTLGIVCDLTPVECVLTLMLYASIVIWVHTRANRQGNHLNAR